MALVLTLSRLANLLGSGWSVASAVAFMSRDVYDALRESLSNLGYAGLRKLRNRRWLSTPPGL